MHTLISYIGKFTDDESDEVRVHTRWLAKQPTLEVDGAFVHKHPRVQYREIFVVETPAIRYHVIDMGVCDGVAMTIPVASKFYSAEEVTKLMR